MEVRSEKNILMTTMSTLIAINNVNYYFVSETQNSSPLFCDGISAVENGSKYILSQYPIDEILVVGSKETFAANDTSYIENLLDESAWKCVCDEWENDYQHGTGKKDGNELSAFEFYKLRMTEFIHQKNVISAEIVSESVSEESRRERIRQIALDVLREMAEEESAETKASEEYIVRCMQMPKKSRALLEKVKKRIMADIEQSFKEEEGYLQYIRQKKELFSRRIDAAIKSREYQKIREDIEKDKALSILEREFLFVSLQRKIDALYYEKEKIHIEKEADELRKENAKLQYQIQNLKNQRAEKELAFAKYALYQSLNGSYIMKPCAGMQKKISMQFIPEKELDKFDNVAGIVNEIYKVGEGMDCVNLYVDMQGGSRTSGYVRNAVLSILSNQETNLIQIRKIVATEFNLRKSWVSPIVDETNRYRIHDLVSGMNAFIRYGKADMLVKYCEDMGERENSSIKKLVLVMKEIDDAISLCDPVKLRKGFRKLISAINDEDKTNENYVSNIFRVLKYSIFSDYEKLLPRPNKEKPDVDYLQLVDWCQRKGLIQQALTIIEDKMPEIILKRFVPISVNSERSCQTVEEKKRLRKRLSKILNYGSFYSSEKNILFYGLTKRIEELWERDDETRYSDEVRMRLEKEYSAGKAIADDYCSYMLGVWKLKKNAVLLQLSGILSNLENKTRKEPYKTLAALKANTYELRDERDETLTVMIDVKFKVSLKRQSLEELLRLHSALKQERNHSNHASEQKKRLSLEIISQAIHEYVEKFRQLM